MNVSIGIDIGGTNMKTCLVDAQGTVLAEKKIKVATIADAQALACTIYEMSCAMCQEAGSSMEQVGSVGVGCPGTVEIRSGSIHYACNLPFQNVPLRKLFHQYSNLPLYIENDANCAALAEYYAGAGRNSKRFLTVTLGTGIGGGLVGGGFQIRNNPLFPVRDYVFRGETVVYVYAETFFVEVTDVSQTCLYDKIAAEEFLDGLRL